MKVITKEYFEKSREWTYSSVTELKKTFKNEEFEIEVMMFYDISECLLIVHMEDSSDLNQWHIKVTEVEDLEKRVEAFKTLYQLNKLK
jgi:hypothetical protein